MAISASERSFWAILSDSQFKSRKGSFLSQAGGQGYYHEYGQLAKFSAIYIIIYHVIMLGKVQACFGKTLISMVFTCNISVEGNRTAKHNFKWDEKARSGVRKGF